MGEKQEDGIKILRELAFTELLLQTCRFLSPISGRDGRSRTRPDVVAVVRCRDCVYAQSAKINKKGFRICPASHMEITDDDFCSYGERRDVNG